MSTIGEPIKVKLNISYLILAKLAQSEAVTFLLSLPCVIMAKLDCVM